MTITGPDVSYYDDNDDTIRRIDFHTMRNHGARFVMIRVGQNVWIDGDFSYNWQMAKETGLPRGSYWFYDSRVSPYRQAELWANQLGSDLGELPLFADLEESYGGTYRGWQNWKLFLERLKQLLPNKMLGIYTAYYYWKDNTLGADLEYFHQYPLWIANYDTTVPMVPKPWTSEEWMFWQYTDKGDGKAYGAESSSIDLNAFNGDEQAFQKILTNVELPPPPPDPQEMHILNLFPGIDFHKVFRFNSWVCVVVSRNQIYKVTRFALRTVSQVAKETGAPIVFNGGAYDSGGAIGLHVVDGIIYSPTTEWEPFANADRNGKFGIYKSNESVSKFMALAGKRMIVENGAISRNTSPAWYEVHPRTLDAVGANGERIQVTVDGRQPGYSEGVTLFQAASILLEFGAIRAIDKDGGGSTAVAINGVIMNRPIDSNIPGKERAVGTHDLIFLADGTIPPSGGGTMLVTKKGVAKLFTRVKYMDGTGVALDANGVEIGLQVNDWVLGNLSTTGSDLVDITEVHRANGVVIPLVKPCKAYAANLLISNYTETPPEPPAPTDKVEVIVKVNDQIVYQYP